MEVRELRVGNYVILKGQLSFIDIPLTLSFAEEMQPVPLTEEILEKAGGLSKIGLMRIIRNYSKDVQYFWEEEGYIVGEEIKYVHELQNIYYAINRKELIIDL